MDQRAVDRLEREIEQAIAGGVTRSGLKKLPLLPSQKTIADNGEGCGRCLRGGGSRNRLIDPVHRLSPLCTHQGPVPWGCARASKSCSSERSTGLTK
jgi:hypothetical protein